MLRPADAIRLVQRCRDSGIEILGIDGFILTPTTTQPTMEHSIDLSGSRRTATSAENWTMAERFLSERLATDLFFEVVLDDEKIR